ncbi:hypothetical protein HS125_01890 [bacterium]|nr:hypothetical protein [bacterium]
MIESNTILLYYAPQSFPCGENSSCCGPTGQSPEELAQYQSALEKAFPSVKVELINVDKASGGRLNLNRDAAAIKLLNSFGPAACPIIAVGGEVVSIGPPVLEELTALLGEKLPKREDFSLRSK